jgi:hypothetical protein
MTCGKPAADLAAAVVPPPAAVVVEQAQPITAELSDFATGATEQNAVYLGNRLAYTKDVEEMDPVRSPKVLLQLLVQMFLFVIAPMLLASGLIFVAAFLWVVSRVIDNPLTSALTAITGVLALLACFVAALCWVVAWFRKVPIRNAEWIMLLDDKGAAAPAVFAHVTGAFERRRTPANTVRVKRVALPGGGHRDLLEVGYGHFIGYVTAYEFGNDLHIGWTYFWRLSIARYVLLGIGNLLNGLRGRQTEVHVLARYEPAKTMREALHAAAREGVDMAGSATRFATGLAMPANVPVDSVAAFEPGGNGLFAS